MDRNNNGRGRGGFGRGRGRGRGGRKGGRIGGGRGQQEEAGSTSSAPMRTVGHTKAWMDGIHNATWVLRQRNLHQYKSQAPPPHASLEDIEHSRAYLDLLEGTLVLHLDSWDHPPQFGPPPFDGPASSRKALAGPNADRTFAAKSRLDGNPFAALQDEADATVDNSYSNQYKNNDNGGVVRHQGVGVSLSMRRIMIRVVTAQSDLLAYHATLCPPKWKLAADTYQASLLKIHNALHLIDAECARLLSETGHFSSSDCVLDAKVVEVSIEFLTSECDRFRRIAIRREAQLMQKLEPQWEERDAVREGMGERWTNNPAPRRDYAQRRVDDERELREVRAALEQLDSMDTEGAVESSRQLQEQGGISDATTTTDRRYNGIRPTDTSRRVPLRDYPDPTDYGWTFTGSWKNTVEFFENADGVKLDWYFTTGTVKTSLDHPRHGKTQLFASRVTPEIYKQILADPRAHTNVRYRRKPGRTGQGRGEPLANRSEE